MAILNNFLLRGASGKLGSFVLKNINGKTYICKRPSHKKSTDPVVLNRQKRFALNTKLSACINSIPELKYFWSKITYNKMSAANAIIKANYHHVTVDKLISTPYLIPDSYNLRYQGFNIQFDNCEIILKYSKEIFDFIKDYTIEKFIKVVGIIHCENNVCSVAEPYYFKSVSSCNYPLSENDTINMSILLDYNSLSFLSQYSDFTLYFAFITSNDEFIPQNAAATFIEKLKIP